MKKIIFLLLLSMVIVFSAEARRYKSRNAQITISVQTFYDQLSPYGDWIYSSDYGYVWRPYFDNTHQVETGFIHPMAGPGIPTTTGDGLPFTMAAGISITI